MPIFKPQRRVRRLLWVAVPLALVVGLLAIADTVTRHVAQDALAGRARQASHASSASVTISGWPFLYDVLAQGQAPAVEVHLTSVPAGQIRLSSLDVRLNRVTISRHDLLGNQRLKVTSIDEATVTAVATAAELSAAAGRTITLPGNGVIRVDGANVEAAATVRVDPGDVVVVSVLSVPVLRIDVGHDPLIPPCPVHVAVLAGKMLATCTLKPIPHRILQEMSAAV